MLKGSGGLANGTVGVYIGTAAVEPDVWSRVEVKGLTKKLQATKTKFVDCTNLLTPSFVSKRGTLRQLGIVERKLTLLTSEVGNTLIELMTY